MRATPGEDGQNQVQPRRRSAGDSGWWSLPSSGRGPPPPPRPLPAEARTSGSGWGRGFALRLVLSGFSPRAQSFHENLTQHHGPRHWDTCHLRDVLFRCHFHNFGSKEQSVLDYPLPEVRARGQGLLLPGANMKHPPPAIQAFLVNID